jgi:DNA mismatch repair protein MutL
MPKIQQMSPHLADLIAAGEVVERPGSVVKELLENAIDAGAKTVTVEIQNGGMTFIRLTDDGCGMAPEDAETAFLRHATSKLRSEEELGAIGTLGFRGEALAAIASVSKIDLMTREAGSDAGTSLHLEAGVVTERGPAGCPVGTTIIVRDLFYNTPARMKFMKRDSVEAGAVAGVIQRQSLAHPEVSIRFLKDGQEQLRTTGDGKLHSAIYAVLGRQTAMDMVPVEGKWEKVSVRGYVSKPTASRGNRNYQHFFVNGRYIKSRTLGAALEQAYQNQLMTGRFPACVLHLTVPLESVDVNVHPAKTEVKFLTEKDVFDCIRYGVQAALNKTPGRPEMQASRSAAPAQQTIPTAQTVQPKAAPVEKPAAAAKPKQDFFRTMTAEQFKALTEKPVEKPAPAVVDRVFRTAVPAVSEAKKDLPVRDSVHSIYHSDKPAAPPAEKPAPEPIPAPAPNPIPVPKPPVEKPAPVPEPEQQVLEMPAAQPWRIVGEVLHTYIIVEEGDHVLFLDKHAAHERVLFEKLKAQDHAVMAQSLLSPVAAQLSKEEAAVVLENRPLLEQFGFFVEDFGDGDVLLRQVPADLDTDEAQAALAALAAQLLEGRQADPAAMRDELLHTMACKSAIKAGWTTAPQEIEALVREVLTRDDIKYCPHGRPVCVTMTQGFLEKQFKRT